MAEDTESDLGMIILDAEDNLLNDVVLLDKSAVSDYNTSNILPLDSSTLSRVKAWLEPTNYSEDGSEYKKHLASHLQGTSEWVFKSPVFQQWHDSSQDDILWLRGIPGAGKSVLAAKLISHLTAEDCPLLYFFFRHTIVSNHRPEAALRDWLAQILGASPPLQLKLKAIRSRKVHDLAIDEIWELLHYALNDIPHVYAIVDALDEMDSDTLVGFLEHLNQLCNLQPGKVKLVLTSRPISTIERVLRGYKLLDIRLDKSIIGPDIESYLSYRLSQSQVPLEIREKVTSQASSKAAGLFLHAKLTSDAICGLKDEAEVFRVLSELPTDISIMYNDLLKEHVQRTGIPRELQILILQLVTHAIRPLRLLEIADCITTTKPQYGDDIGNMKRIVRTACGPLLEVLPDETVRVVHHSLTEYLSGLNRTKEDREEYPIFELGSSHNSLALLCLEYLQSGSLELVELQEFDWIDHRRILKPEQIYQPFTKYATTSWFTHVFKATAANYPGQETNEAIHSLLISSESDRIEKLSLFIREYHGNGTMRYGRRVENLSGAAEALRLAISLNLTCFAESLVLKYGSQILLSSSRTPPLHLAVDKANDDMLRMLLEYQPDLTQHDSQGALPLHVALGYSEHKVSHCKVGILLEAGADPWQAIGPNRDIDDMTIGEPERYPPIQHAIRTCDDAIVQTLLPYIKDVKQAREALAWAVQYSRKETVRMIFDLGLIGVNEKNEVGPWFSQTPLFAACGSRNPKIITLFLEAGADPNILHDEKHRLEYEGKGSNVLHAIAMRGWYGGTSDTGSEADIRECFRLVLEAGANVHQVDGKGNTPLHVARETLVVDCLLEAGANPDAVNMYGETPFHLIWDVKVAETLLPRMNINGRCDSKRLTVLHRVLKGSDASLEKAKMLLDLGADASVTDSDGNTALHYAAEIRGIGKPIGRHVLLKLIEGGVDPDLHNSQGAAAIHYLSSKSPEHFDFEESDVAAFLEITKADLESRDGAGCTFLFNALNARYAYLGNLSNFLAVMVKAGARFDVVDARGRTTAHAVMKQRDLTADALDLMASKGADICRVDAEGNTVWHEAARGLKALQGSLELFKKMTSLGADPAKPDARGRLPLHLLQEYGPVASTDVKTKQTTLLEYLLEMDPKGINSPDDNGIRPLHIASTHSAILTSQLLAAGADVTLATDEGLTALHLAARSRQSNVVGLLLDWLRDRQEAEELQRALAAKDMCDRTALYYACASGRLETVQVLLEAGASVHSETFKGSAWNGCADFEEEQQNWPQNHSRDERSDAGSVTISGNIRPKLESDNVTRQMGAPDLPVERIGEIVDLLITEDSSSGVSFLHQAINSAAERKFDYTVACLVNSLDSLGLSASSAQEVKVKESLERRIVRMTIANPDENPTSRAERLMHEKLFEAFPEAFEKLGDSQIHKVEMLLQGLVLAGHARLLDAVLKADIISDIETYFESPPRKGDWIDYSVRHRTQPLLITACLTERPNMDVMRVLVDKGCRPDLRRSSMVHSNGPDTAIHALVGGEGHWWQINRALPYLMERGANVNIKNTMGVTALHLSLDKSHEPLWNSSMTELLLLAGADPNITDDRGKSSLARAFKNETAYRLLLKHGAVWDCSALAAAIRSQDTKMLQIMLESGANPNTRKIGQEKGGWVSADGQSMSSARFDPNDESELYPLDLLVSDVGRGYQVDDMLSLLLKSGADPNARYPRTTVAHRILQRKGASYSNEYGAQNPYMATILRHPGLDVNLTDSDGKSLLIVACKIGDVVAAGILLDRGADVDIRDDMGMTALHALTSGKKGYSRWKCSDAERGELLRRLATLAPHLIHQADKKGKTPVHYAMADGGDIGEEARKLLSTASDVSARSGKTGDTPLHELFGGEWHIEIDDTDAAKVVGVQRQKLEHLLSLGADINVRNKQGQTPAFNLFKNAAVRVSMPKSKVVTPSACARCTAAGSRCWDATERRDKLKDQVAVATERVLWEYLEKMGLEWHVTNTKGQSLLHIVATTSTDNYSMYEGFKARRLTRFKFLLEKGLDALAEDKGHRTALDVAAAVGAKEILDLFESE